MVRKSELLHDEITAKDDTGVEFSFPANGITPLSTIAIAIKNTEATTRKVTFEAKDRNDEYTSLECTNAADSTTKAKETSGIVSEVWYGNVSSFVGIRCKVPTFVDGKLSLTVTLIS